METRTEIEESLESLSALGKNPNHLPTEHPPPPNYSEGDGGGSGGSLVAIRKLQSLLFRRMLVGVNDGRFFVGAFHCIDKQGNIILQDAVEFRSTRRGRPSPMEQRCLGLILIPTSCRTSCHVDCSVEEQISLLSLCS
ncbi:unnamed protein product [Spirodela intermedia]|uniref:Sm domain-containing protein n=1 Tax=Spirodela intermedia TaxID=51605 RepID=A0A7I8J4X3_SPIIN|nr:unnamed protein product [Spirodela intermedia]CAA6665104.1 unnamed protein product [Spirodela intermedia]